MGDGVVNLHFSQVHRSHRGDEVEETDLRWSHLRSLLLLLHVVSASHGPGGSVPRQWSRGTGTFQGGVQKLDVYTMIITYSICSSILFCLTFSFLFSLCILGSPLLRDVFDLMNTLRDGAS